MIQPGLIAVIGIGNDFRSDDGVGLYVARALGAMKLTRTRVIAGVSDGTALIDAWRDAAQTIIIDCTVSGTAAGTVYRFDALNDDIPADLFGRYSTHAFNIVETVSLARTLGLLPTALTVYGIESKTTALGSQLTAGVKTAADRVIREIAEIIGRMENGCGGCGHGPISSGS